MELYRISYLNFSFESLKTRELWLLHDRFFNFRQRVTYSVPQFLLTFCFRPHRVRNFLCNVFVILENDIFLKVLCQGMAYR